MIYDSIKIEEHLKDRVLPCPFDGNRDIEIISERGAFSELKGIGFVATAAIQCSKCGVGFSFTGNSDYPFKGVPEDFDYTNYDCLVDYIINRWNTRWTYKE